MDVLSAFPSKYVKAEDLPGDVTLVIRDVALEDIETDESGSNKQLPVVYFEGQQKGLVLNKTNAQTITDLLHSSESTHWVGKRITLFPTSCDFRGRQTSCIRVRPYVLDGAQEPQQLPVQQPIQPPPQTPGLF